MKMKGGSRKMNGGCVDSVVAGILLAIIVIAVAVGVYYYYKKHHQPTPTPSMTGGMMEHFASGGEVNLTPNGDETVVALYSADWCPHCQEYKPMWGKMKGSGVATTKSGKKVRFVDVDCTDGAHPSSKEYGVEGYPTVIAISASGHKQLSRPTTMEELEAAL